MPSSCPPGPSSTCTMPDSSGPRPGPSHNRDVDLVVFSNLHPSTIRCSTSSPHPSPDPRGPWTTASTCHHLYTVIIDEADSRCCLPGPKIESTDWYTPVDATTLSRTLVHGHNTILLSTNLFLSPNHIPAPSPTLLAQRVTLGDPSTLHAPPSTTMSRHTRPRPWSLSVFTISPRRRATVHNTLLLLTWSPRGRVTRTQTKVFTYENSSAFTRLTVTSTMRW
jgi:hypothetical protein